jgi:hypothetical protein
LHGRDRPLGDRGWLLRHLGDAGKADDEDFVALVELRWIAQGEGADGLVDGDAGEVVDGVGFHHPGVHPRRVGKLDEEAARAPDDVVGGDGQAVPCDEGRARREPCRAFGQHDADAGFGGLDHLLDVRVIEGRNGERSGEEPSEDLDEEWEHDPLREGKHRTSLLTQVMARIAVGPTECPPIVPAAENERQVWGGIPWGN